MTNPKNHPLWPEFKAWIESRSELRIDLSHEEDWVDFWLSFLAGAQASRKYEANLSTDQVTPPSNNA